MRGGEPARVNMAACLRRCIAPEPVAAERTGFVTDGGRCAMAALLCGDRISAVRSFTGAVRQLTPYEVLTALPLERTIGWEERDEVSLCVPDCSLTCTWTTEGVERQFALEAYVAQRGIVTLAVVMADLRQQLEAAGVAVGEVTAVTLSVTVAGEEKLRVRYRIVQRVAGSVRLCWFNHSEIARVGRLRLSYVCPGGGGTADRDEGLVCRSGGRDAQVTACRQEVTLTSGYLPEQWLQGVGGTGRGAAGVAARRCGAGAGDGRGAGDGVADDGGTRCRDVRRAGEENAGVSMFLNGRWNSISTISGPTWMTGRWSASPLSVASVTDPEYGADGGILKSLSVPMTARNRQLLADSDQVAAADRFNYRASRRPHRARRLRAAGRRHPADSTARRRRRAAVMPSHIVGTGKQWADHAARNQLATLFPDYLVMVSNGMIGQSWTSDDAVKWFPVCRLNRLRGRCRERNRSAGAGRRGLPPLSAAERSAARHFPGRGLHAGVALHRRGVFSSRST